MHGLSSEIKQGRPVSSLATLSRNPLNRSHGSQMLVRAGDPLGRTMGPGAPLLASGVCFVLLGCRA